MLADYIIYFFKLSKQIILIMIIISYLLSIFIIIKTIHLQSSQFHISMFYCGFSGNFCGQSNSDDINPKISFVILAFANTAPDGSIIVDDQNFPNNLVTKWKSTNKKVILSIGGQNGHWDNVLSSNLSIKNFASSIGKALTKYKLDGVDLDIQSYNSPPSSVINMIKQLRNAIGNIKLIIVSPQCVTVYQGVSVPNKNTRGTPWNYFVPIIQQVDDLINYYQPQAYNNWYGFPAGSLNYLKQVYLNWRNLPGLGQWLKPIPNFKGVSGSKLLMGILASTQAGGSSYYMNPSILARFKKFLKSNNYELFGFMIWDSHWDQLNHFIITNAIIN